VRVLGPAGPSAVGVELIDTLGVSRPWWSRTADAVRAAWRGAPPAAASQKAAPAIVSRAAWGAIANRFPEPNALVAQKAERLV
jgi:hypothetical protein